MIINRKSIRYNLLYVDDETLNLLNFEKDFGRYYNLFTTVNIKEAYKILTKKKDKDNVITGFEMGGQDYITKPFNPGERRESWKA